MLNSLARFHAGSAMLARTLTNCLPIGISDLLAGSEAHWSAFSPLSDVPSTRTKSAVLASSRMPGSRRSDKLPVYFTTGLEGSYQDPWISFMMC